MWSSSNLPLAEQFTLTEGLHGTLNVLIFQPESSKKVLIYGVNLKGGGLDFELKATQNNPLIPLMSSLKITGQTDFRKYQNKSMNPISAVRRKAFIE